MELIVECYSGHTYAQEPRAFTWRGRRYVVQAVERAWRTPEGPHFVVKTEEGSTFELAYDEAGDEWNLKVANSLPALRLSSPRSHGERVRKEAM